jgi:hypothetical protein
MENATRAGLQVVQVSSDAENLNAAETRGIQEIKDAFEKYTNGEYFFYSLVQLF